MDNKINNQRPEPAHRNNTKISDFLFGVEYDDMNYNFDDCVEYFRKHHQLKGFEFGACSEIRKGNIVGRNMDYGINPNASAIIRVRKRTWEGGEIKHSSIGVVGCFHYFTLDFARSGYPYTEVNGSELDVYKLLPCRTCDGINDAGVYIGVNVVPTGETVWVGHDTHPGEYGYGAADTPTEVESDKHYCTMFLTRYVLDNASSAKNAIKLLKGVHWYDPINYPDHKKSQSFHWMISDKNDNYIVEFIENELVVIDVKESGKDYLGRIMTNFNNSIYVPGHTETMQAHGIGYERWDLLKQHYDSSEKSMKEIMSSVWFSKSYTEVDRVGNYYFPVFATEMASADEELKDPKCPGYTPPTAKDLYHNKEIFKIDKNLQELVTAAHDGFLFWSKEVPLETKYNQPNGLWITVHTCIYNLEPEPESTYNYGMEVLIHEGMVPSGANQEDGYNHFSIEGKPFAKPETKPFK